MRHPRLRRRRPAILVAAAVAAISLLATTAAVATPTSGTTGPDRTIGATETPCQPPPSPSRLDPSPVQDQLERVGHRILDLVAATGYPGFTGLSADLDNARLLLCWVRAEPQLPAPVAAIVASPGEPVTVVRQYGDYGKADLDSRVGSILANPDLEAEFGVDLHTVTVPEDGTGLVAGVDTGSSAPPPSGLQDALTGRAGVPVTVELGSGPEPTGERCGIVIRRADVNYTIDTYDMKIEVRAGVYASTAGPRVPANAVGNSGGPVFLRGASAAAGVKALGTISASRRPKAFPCELYDARTCYPDMYYADIDVLLREYGAALA